ncbi:MAG TPA: SDR family oxidoreductase [Stellaceae bacterium]|nr:SDR family oxidoreductase [Stellaceae bacterium]
MHEKICLVTGATSGIGKATAFELAKRGARVVLLCRNRQKGTAVVSELQRGTKNSAIDLLLADLSSQQQIRAAAAEFAQKYDRLHVLINNAGAMFPRRMESSDGIEMTLAVNHLAPFLLANLLIDTMKSSGSARIINVNSDAHEQGRIDLADLQMRNHYGRGVGMRAYANAKLANLLTVYELARRLQGTSVTVNALHPGYVSTNIVNIGAATGLWRLAVPFWGLAMRLILTPAQGAATSIHLACSPQVSHISGKYFEKCVPVASSRASHDKAMQARMWQLSEELTAE